MASYHVTNNFSTQLPYHIKLNVSLIAFHTVNNFVNGNLFFALDKNQLNTSEEDSKAL